MSRAVRGAVVLALAVLALAAVWRLLPASVPLYDGLLLPPQPYRYLNPPPGVVHTSKKPTSASQTFDLVGGQSGASFVGTGEAPPQARLIIDDAGLQIPKGEKSFTLTIYPVSTASPKPDGPLDGNIYQLKVTGSSGAALKLAKPATVVLRGTGQKGTPLIEELSGGSWQHLTTTAAGTNDTYYGNITTIGPVALVFAGKGGGSNNSWIPFAVVGAVVVVILAAGLLLIRLSRRRAEVSV